VSSDRHLDTLRQKESTPVTFTDVLRDALAETFDPDTIVQLLEDGGFVAVPFTWQYNYEREKHNGYRHISDTNRTLDNWLTSMGDKVYRRKVYATGGAGEWEPVDVQVTIELDVRPWLFPGKHPEDWPVRNRRAQDETGDMEWHPRGGYEQDITRYGFSRALCGRTDHHWPHASAAFPYCNGMTVTPITEVPA